MRDRVRALGPILSVAALSVACGSDPIRTQPSGTAGTAGTSGGDVQSGGTLTVNVSASRVTYVNLATPAVVTETDAKHSTDWDLAFVGYDVFTNGGLSGPGGGS